MTVLLRFAPSPTGALHLGGLRTALYNHLYARKLGGKWILRIEDTDATRAVPGAVDGIRSALEWAGLDYDYGPGIQGPHAPYFQSQRLDLYHSHANRLLKSGHAYRCFCSPDTLSATRERLARTGSNATYDKACLNLTEEEVMRRVKAGHKHVIRLNDSNLPNRPTPRDLIFGNVRDAHASLPTDPVLLKSDLFPTYHLASVVDDSQMGITHVLRGEEWLPSLPLHLDLYAALKLSPPQFAHLPLMLNPDGTKMSKRKGDVHVLDYQRKGWEPDAVLNWLALAGWGTQRGSASDAHSKKSAPDSTAVMTLPELIEKFDLSSLTHRRSVLDPAKLEYLNKHHLMRKITGDAKTAQSLAEKVHGAVKERFGESPHTSIEYIQRVVLALQGRLVNIMDLPELAPYFFVDPDWSSEEAKKLRSAATDDEYRTALTSILERLPTNEENWIEDALREVLHSETNKLGLKQKVYMSILRHALTGQKAGPSVATIMETLGEARTRQRLQLALTS
ncbi:glutamyl-tRNA synthetase [Panus rudis PR-1116 ss-1]|nr:glutamyl-tRNA synthetase [Panus rudis PR-1116 ss-1]